MERQQLEIQTKIVRLGGDGAQRDGAPGGNPVANGDPTLPPGTTRTPSITLATIDTDAAMRRKRKEYERATRDSEKQLTKIAEESGGRIFLPVNSSELMTQADNIARDIGSQYVLTYRDPVVIASPDYRPTGGIHRRIHPRDRAGVADEECAKHDDRDE
jgi:hypothetical protein